MQTLLNDTNLLNYKVGLPQSTLQGQIERIAYVSDETSYTVAKVKVYGHRDLVTVIGAIVNSILGVIISIIDILYYIENVEPF